MDKAKKKKIIIATVSCVVVVGLALGLGLGLGLREKYPNCKVYGENRKRIGDGVCDHESNGDMQSVQHQNIEECGWDGGDCVAWNEKYMNCVPGVHPSTLVFRPMGWAGGTEGLGIAGGSCNQDYNNEQCGYDDGNCLDLNKNYPGCKAKYDKKLGDGICQNYDRVGSYEVYSNAEIPVEDKGTYNTEECEFDGGDCVEFNEKFPNCIVDEPFRVGDNICNRGFKNTAECGFDSGDCNEFNFKMDLYPNCLTVYNELDPSMFGDGKCNNDGSNTEACGFDDGDCVEFNNKYPNCKTNPNQDLWVEDAEKIGDGVCNYGNIEACEFDGGDCVEFNKKYPNCRAEYPDWVGNGECDEMVNTADCGFDGGDCENANENDWD